MEIAPRPVNSERAIAKNTKYYEVTSTWTPVTVGTSPSNAKRIYYRVPWNARVQGALVTSDLAVLNLYDLSLKPAPGTDPNMVVIQIQNKRTMLHCRPGWTKNMRVYVGRKIHMSGVELASLWGSVAARLFAWQRAGQRTVVVVDSMRPIDHDGAEYKTYNYGLTHSLATSPGWGRRQWGRNAILAPVRQLVVAFAEFEDASFQNFGNTRMHDDATFKRDLDFLANFNRALRLLSRHFHVSAIVGNVEEKADAFSPRKPSLKVTMNTHGTAFSLMQPNFVISMLSRMQVTYASRAHFVAVAPIKKSGALLPIRAKATYDVITPFADPYSYATYHRHRGNVEKFVRGGSHAQLVTQVKQLEDTYIANA